MSGVPPPPPLMAASSSGGLEEGGSLSLAKRAASMSVHAFPCSDVKTYTWPLRELPCWSQARTISPPGREAAFHGVPGTGISSMRPSAV
jgi:hypothetical protein